jgi:hypothetical protein
VPLEASPIENESGARGNRRKTPNKKCKFGRESRLQLRVVTRGMQLDKLCFKLVDALAMTGLDQDLIEENPARRDVPCNGLARLSPPSDTVRVDAPKHNLRLPDIHDNAAMQEHVHAPTQHSRDIYEAIKTQNTILLLSSSRAHFRTFVNRK